MTLESYWLENCPYYDPRVVIYACKMFIRLPTGADLIKILQHKFYAMVIFKHSDWLFNF